MDKSEVIILSSDDENDTRQFEKPVPKLVKSDEGLNTSLTEKEKTSEIDFNWKITSTPIKKSGVINKVPKKQCHSGSKENPEVVDLVDCLDKSPKIQNPLHKDLSRNGTTEPVQSHLKLEVIDIDTAEDDSNKCSIYKINGNVATAKPKKLQEQSHTVESSHKTVTAKVTSPAVKSEEIREVVVVDNQNAIRMTNKDSSKNLKLFTEFVELCGSLETVTNDRVRLTKKLMKSYGEADSSYIKSQEFRELIEKCKKKLTKSNLYLIARDMKIELSFRKQIKVPSLINKSIYGNTDAIQENENYKLKKRTKFVKKIFKKLDKLGSKIRELEVEEVDLSDEEGSSYVRLQRYRERFCQIYKKLCKYTNEIPDANELYNRRICFTESKYPTINKCIELWLNKVKRFPDFTDIMKLLESQSSSLGLPANRESLRPIAVEIFQQVGAMLQRRRKYDLWDSFCGFLGDEMDPANSDPALDKVLNENFEARIKKEQEIFQLYSELQERERLEPEEVPEEEANDSPVESGNEDEKEIEEIENDIHKRLDLAIKEDTKKGGSRKRCSNWDEDKSNSLDEAEHEQSVGSPKRKQSKNNYKNCKSLKWRSENVGKLKSESGNSEDSNAGPDHYGKNMAGVSDAAKKDSSDSNEGCTKSEESGKNDSDLELLGEEAEEDASSKKEAHDDRTTGAAGAPCKRSRSSINKPSAKKKCINYWKCDENSLDRYLAEIENENFPEKANESFEIRYCHIFADCVFENLTEKKKAGEKRKVFRDMTNVIGLMKLHGKRRSFSGGFDPEVFRRRLRGFEKPSWKRRFKVNFRMVGSRNEKCALDQEEKTGKSVDSGESGESDEKDIPDRSERGGRDEGGSFFSGHGGESHEGGGDEDRNRKNGKTDSSDVSENKPEEEEEEDEEDRDKNETESKSEASEHSPSLKSQEDPETEMKTVEVVEIESPGEMETILPKRQSKCPNEEEVIKNGSANEKIQQKDAKEAGKAGKPLQVQYPGGKAQRKSPASASDEERVKRFLKHSPSSISITPPRKLTFSKHPSETVLQALATLRNLKDISATIVRGGKPKNEDDVTVIGGSYKRHENQISDGSKRCRTNSSCGSNSPAVTSSTGPTSAFCTTPKIVTVQGNVSGFDSGDKPECDSTSIKISNVWGGLPNNFMQSMQDAEPVMPGFSGQNLQQNNLQTWNVAKKKNAKKKVEYVVLE